jgi:hypothetical protein
MGRLMSVYYRKNDSWTTIYISISISNLDKLSEVVEKTVREQQGVKPNSKKWKAIDIVDTEIVGKAFNSHRNETTIEMLIHVADMTGKAL